MRRKHWLVLPVLLSLLAQMACTFSAAMVPTPTPADMTPPADQAIPTDTNACPAETANAKLFKNEEDGYCFLYPANYSVVPPRFVVINPINAPGDTLGDAWLDVRVEAANGRTADQIAGDAITAAGPGFNTTLDQLVVDDTRAIVVDGLPGPDPLRNVYIVSNDRLYTFTFMPWDQSTALEALYDWTMKTLQFLPPTKPLQ